MPTEREELIELRDNARKLLALLDDPHPGLASWQGFLRERLAALELPPTLSQPVEGDIDSLCLKAADQIRTVVNRNVSTAEKFGQDWNGTFAIAVHHAIRAATAAQAEELKRLREIVERQKGAEHVR